MISRPLNYAIFTLVIIITSIIVFPFPIRLLEMYSGAGKFELATREAAKMLESEGDNRPVFDFMANKAAAEGDPELLIQYLQRLGRISLNKGRTYQRLAEAYTWTGQPEQAAQAWENKLALDPGDEPALQALTDLYQRLDEPVPLARVVEMRLALEPDNPELLTYLASIQSELGNYQQEIGLLKRLVALEPNEPKNIRRLGDLYLATKQADEGLKEFGGLLEENPRNRVLAASILPLLIRKSSQEEWNRLKGHVFSAMGGYESALDQIYQTSLDNNRVDFGAWALAQIAQEHPAAQKALALAVELYRGNDQSARAADLVERLGREQPDNPELLKQMAALDQEVGNTHGAYDALQKLVELQPQSQEAWHEFLKVASWSERPGDELRAVSMRVERYPEETDALKRLADLAQAEDQPGLAKDTLLKLAGLEKVPNLNARLALLDQAIKDRAGPPEEPETPPAPQPTRIASVGPAFVPGALGPIEPRTQTPPARQPQQTPAMEPEPVREPEPESEPVQEVQEPAGPAQPEAAPQPQETAPPGEPELPEDLGVLRAMLQKSPGNPKLLDQYLKVVLYEPIKSDDLAFLQSLAQNGADQALLNRIAQVFVSADQVPMAIPVLERLARMRPQDQDLRRDLAKYYSWTDQPQKQLTVMAELVELDPQNPELRRQLLKAAQELNAPELAITQAEWLQTKGQLGPEGILRLAEAYVQQNRPLKALEVCQGLLGMNAPGAALARAGEIAMAQERYRLAQAYFTEALSKDASQHLYLKQLAQAEMALGRVERAVMLMQAYTRRHRDYEAHYLLGEYLNSLGRNAEAQREFKQAQLLMGMRGGGTRQ